jgi:peptide/nickel transport system substrate-binding protein
MVLAELGKVARCGLVGGLTAVTLLTGGAGATEITIAQSVDAISLDPAFRGDTVTGNVQRHVFDTLLLRRSDLSIGPGLAEAVDEVSRTEWTIHLRKGVTFSNGEPLDAAAVKFSIERAQNPELKAPTRGWWLPFKTMEAMDDHTLKITTAGPDPLFRARLALFEPVPPKYVREVGDTTFGQKPIGTGPYKLVEWRRNDAAIFEPNPAYWDGKPAFDRVVFRVVPEELSRVAALQTGEADVVTNLSPSQAAFLESASGLRIESAPSTRVMAIQFDPAMPPGDQLKFREAVAYAINRDELIKGLLRGYGAPVTSFLSPALVGWSSDKELVRPYDPQKATVLVKELGIGDQEIVMRTPSAGFPNDRETALAVAAQLARVGLKIRVRPDEYGHFLDDLRAHKMAPIYLNGQGNIWLDPYPQIEAFHKSDGFLSTWKDPELDMLLARSNDVAEIERRTVIGQVLDRLSQTVAAVPLYAQVVLYGVRNGVKWQPRPDEQILAVEMTKTIK